MAHMLSNARFKTAISEAVATAARRAHTSKTSPIQMYLEMRHIVRVSMSSLSSKNISRSDFPKIALTRKKMFFLMFFIESYKPSSMSPSSVCPIAQYAPFSLCRTPFEDIDADLRAEYPIVEYAPGHYPDVQNLRVPLARYRAAFGQKGTVREIGDFEDQQTAALDNNMPRASQAALSCGCSVPSGPSFTTNVSSDGSAPLAIAEANAFIPLSPM